MSRLTTSCVAVVVLSAGVAFADSRGEVVSFVCVGPGPCDVLVVPAEGFILTDVTCNADLVDLVISEDSELVSKLFFETGTGGIQVHYQFASGIRFAAGSTVSLSGLNASTTVGVMGYIPCPSPCFAGPVPALGNFALGVLVATLLAAGGFVIRRRRVA